MVQLVIVIEQPLTKKIVAPHSVDLFLLIVIYKRIGGIYLGAEGKGGRGLLFRNLICDTFSILVTTGAWVCRMSDGSCR